MSDDYVYVELTFRGGPVSGETDLIRISADYPIGSRTNLLTLYRAYDKRTRTCALYRGLTRTSLSKATIRFLRIENY